MRIVRLFLTIGARFPKLMLGSVALILSMNLVEALSVFSLAPIIDYLLHTSPEATSPLTQRTAAALTAVGYPVNIWSLFLLFIAFLLAKSVFQILVHRSTLLIKYAVVKDLTMGSFEDFFRARWAFFSGNQQGVLINTFMRELEAVGNAFGGMTQLMSGVLQIFIFLAVPLYISWKITLICLAMAGIIALPFLMLGRFNYRFGQVNTSTANRLSSIIQESMSAAKLILSFGNRKVTVDAVRQTLVDHQRASLRSQTFAYALPVIFYPLAIFILVTALYASKQLSLPLAETGVLLYSLLKILPLFGNIVGNKNAVDGFFPSYEQVTGFRQEARSQLQQSGERSFGGLHRELRLDNVCFTHPGREQTISNLSLVVPQGGLVAIVGDSGAGKTTLVDLILGLYPPASGRIEIDNVPLEEIDIISYRQGVGYVSQNSTLFNMSIRDNLLWAMPTATQADISEACSLANANGFIEELADRYDTVVGDDGVRLSGGQAQRIALARAMLRRPELLILDEATSNLDSESERAIQAAIETIAETTTIIAIAHRLSTIRRANTIYVLRKGRIVESGSYTDLTAEAGYFSRMVESQSLPPADGVSA